MDSDPQREPGPGAGSSPAQRLVQGALTVSVLVLLFGVVLPGLIDYDEVLDALRAVSLADLAVMLGLFVLIEALKGLEPALAIPRLPFRKALVAAETATAISNVVPGPSGTAMRYYVYRSWGLTPSDFARGWLLTSLLNNGVILMMPVIALAIYATQGDPEPPVVWLAAIGITISAIGAVVLAACLRRERLAHRAGRLVGRIVTWARGIVGRPTPTDFADAAVAFRGELISTLGASGAVLAGTIVLKYAATGACLIVALRAVGVPAGVLPVTAIFAAYAFVRLVTVVEITPGGVGVVEVAYAAALGYAAGTDAYHDRIFAGVLLFRLFTYVLPVPAGGVCYVIFRRKRSWRAEAPGVARPDGFGVPSALAAGPTPGRA